MTPTSTIFALLICSAVEALVIGKLARDNDKMKKLIRELNHENSRLEIDNCALAAKLNTTKRLLQARNK